MPHYVQLGLMCGWRELQILLVAYSGLRWGEHVALAPEQIDVERRRISVNRQMVETGSALIPGLPKGRRRRVTMFPEVTPAGVDLVAMVELRLQEIGDCEPFFPAPRGSWQRRSNWSDCVKAATAPPAAATAAHLPTAEPTITSGRDRHEADLASRLLSIL